MFANKEGCWDDGHVLHCGNAVFCGIRLVAWRFGSGAQKGTFLYVSSLPCADVGVWYRPR